MRMSRAFNLFGRIASLLAIDSHAHISIAYRLMGSVFMLSSWWLQLRLRVLLFAMRFLLRV
jgi:competence protein ComGF